MIRQFPLQLPKLFLRACERHITLLVMNEFDEESRYITIKRHFGSISAKSTFSEYFTDFDG